MRLNKSAEWHISRIEHSKLWLQLLSGMSWLGGAGVCAVWMVHGGGAVRPLVCFAVWAMGLFFVTMRALAGTSDSAPKLGEVLQAVRYGGYSAVLLGLATLFCEYWPVTVSMAFLFAICRSFKESDDTPAYV